MKVSKIAGGCILTLLCWVIAGWSLLATLMGDCFPNAHHACPSDHDRHVAVLVILLVAIGVNACLLLLVSREKAARDDQNSG